MVSNGYINWNEDPIDPRHTSFLAPRALREDPDIVMIMRADELMNYAEKLFREALANSSAISLAERDTILLSGAYQNAQLHRHQVFDQMAIPTDYRHINSSDKAFFRALAGETGVQRSMFVEFDLTKALSSGARLSGSIRAELTMRVLVFDAQGRAIFRASYSLWSSSTTRTSSGAYSQSELAELFESAFSDVFQDFLLKLN
jgi:hypothetical protein